MRFPIIGIIMFLFLNVSCGNTNSTEAGLTTEITAAELEKIAGKKIFFGHQSVGYNLVDGISAITGGKLNIAEKAVSDSPGFYHAGVGKNKDPQSKINGFRNFLETNEKPDIAFFKFCYVDITADTDIEKLFSGYRAAMAELKAQYPGVRFVHFTVPLMTYPGGIKVKIRELLNKPVWGVGDNIRRNEFNRLMVREYGDREPLFDIALAEATLPDGTAAIFHRNGMDYYYLANRYTSDAGHLNAEGQRHVARQFLDFLGGL